MPETKIHVEEAVDADFLSPDEHTAIGDGPPHHSRKHMMVSPDDHDVGGTPTDGQVLVWSAAHARWEPRDVGGITPVLDKLLLTVAGTLITNNAGMLVQQS